MEQKKRRFAVLTGGGDCPGLNAVIRAVVKTFLQTIVRFMAYSMALTAL